MKPRVLALALLSASLPAVFAQSTTIRVAIIPDSQSLTVTPQTETVLRVTVFGSDGKVAPDLGVVFVAPESGATGSFPEAPSDGATLYWTKTDSDGSASARFLPNGTAGIYLLAAAVDGSDASVTFAVTSSADAPSNTLSGDEARAALRAQLTLKAFDDESQRLHGPVLLPAGSTVKAAGQSSRLFPTTPATTERSSWLFWIDDNPLARFEHPTRFVILDAASGSSDFNDFTRIATLTRQGWWPEVILPGADTPVSLLSPLRTNSGLTVSRAARARPAAVELARAPFANVSPDQTCAIVIYGPSDTAMSIDADDMSKFFHEKLLIPETNIFRGTNLFGFSRPTNGSMLQAFVRGAVRQGCKKVYLYVSAHGSLGANGNS
ncbi:MAG: hypothetical protein HYR60_30665 [Acidobacteria bacterium]|nr:hypothetical protein [Acidobacteriota bacterium]